MPRIRRKIRPFFFLRASCSRLGSRSSILVLYTGLCLSRARASRAWNRQAKQGMDDQVEPTQQQARKLASTNALTF